MLGLHSLKPLDQEKRGELELWMTGTEYKEQLARIVSGVSGVQPLLRDIWVHGLRGRVLFWQPIIALHNDAERISYLKPHATQASTLVSFIHDQTTHR